MSTLILAAALAGQARCTAPIYYTPPIIYPPQYPPYPYYWRRGWYYPSGPKVIAIPRPVMDLPGVTGRVVDLDEEHRVLTLRLPAETVKIPYKAGTKWRSVRPFEFPDIVPGLIVNVQDGFVTVLD